MARKPHPPHPVHSGDGDMPWLNPNRLPGPARITGSMKEAVDSISHILRSLPSRHDRHRCLGLVLSSLIESEHLKGLNDILQLTMHQTNRYNYIDR